jgi:NDP-sugar pyrophosphorylase family protein
MHAVILAGGKGVRLRPYTASLPKPLVPIGDEYSILEIVLQSGLPYAELMADHLLSRAPLTIATDEREVGIDFGVLDVDAGSVVGFREKPTLQYRVSMGVYGVSTKALRKNPEGRPFGFDQLVLDLIAQGIPPASFGFTGYWLDIGRSDDYNRANLEFPRLRQAPVHGPTSGVLV